MNAPKKPGPDPEVLKVPLPFDEAVKAALHTKPTDKPPPMRKKRQAKRRGA